MSILNHAMMKKRGLTYYGSDTPPSDYGDSVNLEGANVAYDAFDKTTFASSRPTKLSAERVRGLIVRNKSGFNLLPGDAVSWLTGYFNKRVAGKVALTGAPVAGVVDDCLPAAGVQDGDLFFLAREGPHTVKTSATSGAENVIAEGARLYSVTAATTGAVTAGRAQQIPSTYTATQTTDGTMQAAILNVFATAQEANTTTQTSRALKVRLHVNTN